MSLLLRLGIDICYVTCSSYIYNMKRLLSTSLLTLIVFSIIFSCSADEDDSPPPSNIVQTPEPEPTTPDPVQYTFTINSSNGGTVSTQGGNYEAGLALGYLTEEEFDA